jgi:hypothetical protein
VYELGSLLEYVVRVGTDIIVGTHCCINGTEVLLASEMTSDYTIRTMTLDSIVAIDTSVAFAIPYE